MPTVPSTGTGEPDVIGATMTLLGDTKIMLSGSIAERDYRRLLDLRADVLRAASLLRASARTSEMFAAQYDAGADQAIWAARLLGRAHVELSRLANASGGYYGPGWSAVEIRVNKLLETAKSGVVRAHAAAYTGTHY